MCIQVMMVVDNESMTKDAVINLTSFACIPSLIMHAQWQNDPLSVAQTLHGGS